MNKDDAACTSVFQPVACRLWLSARIEAEKHWFQGNIELQKGWEVVLTFAIDEFADDFVKNMA